MLKSTLWTYGIDNTIQKSVFNQMTSQYLLLIVVARTHNLLIPGQWFVHPIYVFNWYKLDRENITFIEFEYPELVIVVKEAARSCSRIMSSVPSLFWLFFIDLRQCVSFFIPGTWMTWNGKMLNPEKDKAHLHWHWLSLMAVLLFQGYSGLLYLKNKKRM